MRRDASVVVGHGRQAPAATASSLLDQVLATLIYIIVSLLTTSPATRAVE
ncbi:MAG TPA: hypothetical protein VMV25_06360 [Steroidobacteraceae bacterium]|nr:hypothetical protein [Steroidobacteraceae bacterium]